MIVEIITDRPDLLIRRQRLRPGEASPWHTDACERFTVVVSGDRLRIEFADASVAPLDVEVGPGLADWEQPEPRVHRAVNAGSEVYEEVVTFYRKAGEDPQPTVDPNAI